MITPAGPEEKAGVDGIEATGTGQQHHLATRHQSVHALGTSIGQGKEAPWENIGKHWIKEKIWRKSRMKVSDQHQEPLVPIYGKCPTKWGECPIQKPSILIGELNTVRLPQIGRFWLDCHADCLGFDVPFHRKMRLVWGICISCAEKRHVKFVHIFSLHCVSVLLIFQWKRPADFGGSRK